MKLFLGHIGNLDPSSSPSRDLPPFEDEAENVDDAADEEEGEELFGENLERYVLCKNWCVCDTVLTGNMRLFLNWMCMKEKESMMKRKIMN